MNKIICKLIGHSPYWTHKEPSEQYENVGEMYKCHRCGKTFEKGMYNNLYEK